MSAAKTVNLIEAALPKREWCLLTKLPTTRERLDSPHEPVDDDHDHVRQGREEEHKRLSLLSGEASSDSEHERDEDDP